MIKKLSQTPEPLPLLFRVSEGARAIAVGRRKMYDLLAKGAIPSVRLDGALRVPVVQLKEWIAAHTTTTLDV
jgi:excisionase family DNA binding protein